ncbi:MAG: septum site-determining protein MinD [Candidatus Altiarchaeales archaeon]|nr:MAG: septum site-determining protein MinD [Candidatus Altiarchaeales archaeon]RLI94316.1 MAG: septum site-determining protein MinD [Candidatus Altiarchaeales archaeon]
MSHIIGVVSGKGGVGKTTFSINLAAALAEFGQESIVIDLDIENPNISLQLGVPPMPLTLQDALDGSVRIRHSIFYHPVGLKIIPSSITPSNKNIDLSRLKKILRELDDTIILDSPPGMNEIVKSVIECSDSVIVVTNPEVPAVTDALKVIKLAKWMKKENIGVVINRVRNDAYELTPDEVELMCEVPIISRISEDSFVRKAAFENIPVIHKNPYSRASIDFKYLAARLLRKEYKPPSLLFLRRLLRFRG